MKLLKLGLVASTVFLVLILPIQAVNLYTETLFDVYIGNSGSLGFRMQPNQWVRVTATTGNLNSSVGDMGQDRSEGFFIFTPNETGTLTFGVGNLTVWCDGDPVGTGETKSMTIGTPMTIRWRPIAWDPFEYYTYPVIGLTGFVLTAASGFYLANKIRNRDDDLVMGICYSIVFLILGGGFIMVWLWG